MQEAPPGIDFEERMKRDTVRPQDKLDAQVIKEEFNLEEG
jgi:hypothetical protein